MSAGGARGSTAIVWFRRDLRLGDHPAIHIALERDQRLIPFFCFDEAILAGRHRSGPRTQFLLECLAELGRELRARGSGLVIRRGDPVHELSRLVDETRAEVVHFTADVTPYARRRGARVASALDASGVELAGHPGLNAVDDVFAIRTRQGRPYTVFSPFHRSWLEEPRREVLLAPDELPSLPSKLLKGRIPTLASLGLEQEVAEPATGGESQARRALERFLAGPVDGYDDDHDALGRDRTSRLSPYLRFGCLSPRQVEARLSAGSGADAFRRQLCWRDFYAHVLGHFPGNLHSELQQRYRGAIRWSRSRRDFDAWREGLTGYPLVDAAMRQLRREGWMHNRARLVAGSFLTKDLGIDWRWGEGWFMRLLLDGDEPQNNGNWQWIGSVGTDRQPAARRIYNPTLQMERHDPSGSYVRRYVPELDGVADEFLAEPWRMDTDEQRRAGCVIGRDYPAPIVDHAEARAAALDRYRL